MSQPTPVLRRGRWTLDLRWAGLGQYTLQTPGVVDLAIQATQESFAVFLRERAAAEQKSAQGSIFAGPSLRKVAGDWLEEREHRTRGGRRYVSGYVRKVIEKFGGRAVRQFEPPQGSKVLKDWRDDMHAAGLSPKTRRNYLNVLMQILAYAAQRELIRALPIKCEPTKEDEDLASPDSPWYTEADFRALRDGLFVGSEQELSAWLARAGGGRTVEDYIARRRLYLSFGFYTGMHVYDLDHLDDACFSPDIGTFKRTNHKSARTVPSQWFEAPQRLTLDVQAEIDRLGRPWCVGELICGGAWPNGSRVLQATAVRLGLPTPVNFRSVFRRSTVHEYCIRGWTIDVVAKLLGHVDQRMISTVYRRMVDRQVSPERIPWDCESAARLLRGRLVTSRAKVSQLRPVPLAPKLQKERA